MEELEALIILTGMPYLGSVKIRLLLRHFGTALHAIKASLEDLAQIPGFGPKILDSWSQYLKNQDWKKNLALLEQYQAGVITYSDPQYPKHLLELPDFPILLYIKGSISKNDSQRSLAIVGTRHASLYGIEMAKKISRELAQFGFTVVSGLARGIDTAAHLGALECGRTLAVLGSGLANIYPVENKVLAETISRQGALISEFPMLAPPDRFNFPKRNRIVSGMTMGTILIEAPQKSGAMLTSIKAYDQKRPVFTLPGRVDIENFKGNHSLIKENKAILIEGSQDIIQFFEGSIPFSKHSPKKEAVYLEEEENFLMQHLTAEEFSVNDLLNRVNYPVQKINVLLMSLTLKKVIKEYPGKIYKKI